MSWDASLHLASRPDIWIGDWNYTHNTNAMIAAAFEAVSGEETPECGGPLGPVIGAAWWDRLHGKTGTEGGEYLAQIITVLEAEPARYEAMNPPNGWGSYSSLLAVLKEMRDAVPDEPTVWQVHG